MKKTAERPLVQARDEKTFFVLNKKTGLYQIASYKDFPDQKYLGVDKAYLKKAELVTNALERALQGYAQNEGSKQLDPDEYEYIM